MTSKELLEYAYEELVNNDGFSNAALKQLNRLIREIEDLEDMAERYKDLCE